VAGRRPFIVESHSIARGLGDSIPTRTTPFHRGGNPLTPLPGFTDSRSRTHTFTRRVPRLGHTDATHANTRDKQIAAMFAGSSELAPFSIHGRGINRSRHRWYLRAPTKHGQVDRGIVCVRARWRPIVDGEASRYE